MNSKKSYPKGTVLKLIAVSDIAKERYGDTPCTGYRGVVGKWDHKKWPEGFNREGYVWYQVPPK